MNGKFDIINKAEELQNDGHYEESKIILEDFLSKYPDSYDANIVLGTVFKNSNNSKKALEYFLKAESINSERADSHNNIGSLYYDKKNNNLALKYFKKAFSIAPDEENIRNNFFNALYNNNDFEQALEVLKGSVNNIDYEKFLKCLLAKEEYDEFWSLIESLSPSPTNIGVAAISAYAAEKLEKKDPYNFCKNPLEHIYFSKVNLLDEIIFNLIKEVKISIEKQNHQFRTQTLIFNGKQSSGNFFNNSELGYTFGSYISGLVSDYKNNFSQKNFLIHSNWPKKNRMNGWFISLSEGGYLDYHNHNSGWVSGSIYLQIPEKVKSNEGSIEFSLSHPDYPKINDKKLETRTFDLSTGDVVMFPSSLFHRTTPFSSSKKRVCFAFDLAPDELIR